MNRLREAREYMGLSDQDMSDILNCYTARIYGFENGTVEPLPEEWERMSRLYRRPVAWLKGEPAPPVAVPADIVQLMEDKQLSDADRSEVVAFVEFLSHKT